MKIMRKWCGGERESEEKEENKRQLVAKGKIAKTKFIHVDTVLGYEEWEQS